MKYLVFISITVGGIYLALLSIELLSYALARLFRALVSPHPKQFNNGERYTPNAQSYPQTIQPKKDIMQCFKLCKLRSHFNYKSRYSSDAGTNDNAPKMVFQEGKPYSDSELNFVDNAHKRIISGHQPNANSTQKNRSCP